MSQASEDTVYVCCECVPEPDLGVALHMMPCEKHGRGWHRIVKREVRSVQEPSPAALIVKGQRVQECDPHYNSNPVQPVNGRDINGTSV